MLSLDVAAADLDGVQLVLADAAVKDLLPAGAHVEPPLALLLDDGDRHGPIFIPDREDDAVLVLGVRLEHVPFFRPGSEGGDDVLGLHLVLGDHEILVRLAEDPDQGRDVPLLGRLDQRVSRFLGSGKSLLARSRLGGGSRLRGADCQRGEARDCDSQREDAHSETD